jgi:hypothetical protein
LSLLSLEDDVGSLGSVGYEEVGFKDEESPPEERVPPEFERARGGFSLLVVDEGTYVAMRPL